VSSRSSDSSLRGSTDKYQSVISCVALYLAAILYRIYLSSGENLGG
jgi:hypothetical protein